MHRTHFIATIHIETSQIQKLSHFFVFFFFLIQKNLQISSPSINLPSFQTMKIKVCCSELDSMFAWMFHHVKKKRNGCPQKAFIL